MFDWKHHAQPSDFNPDFVTSVYYKLKNTGSLTNKQKQGVINTACRKKVRDWVRSNPDKKGTGPPPPEPPPELAPEGCMLIDDEDDN